MIKSRSTWWDKFWKDKHGKVVLWQNPNLPLWSWLAATVLTHLLPYGRLNFLAALVAFGSIFTWAYLEIRHGVNYFRRSVGLVVLTWILASRL